MAILADLHVHGSDSHRFEWYKGKPYSPQDVPEKLLAHCFSKASRSQTDKSGVLVGVIDFDDRRAEHILGSIKNQTFRSPSLSLEGDNKDLISVRKYYGASVSKRVHFISGQEIPTDQGHVLVVGAGKPISSRVLGEVLKEAKDFDALIIADHPLAELGPVGRTVCKFANGNPNLGIRERNVERYRNYFDAIEAWNGNFGADLARRTLALARKYDLPVIASSDSHKVSHVLHSYTQFEGLDFSNPEKLKASIRHQLQNPRNVALGRSNGLLEPYRHGFEVFKSHLLLKTGPLKRT